LSGSHISYQTHTLDTTMLLHRAMSRSALLLSLSLSLLLLLLNPQPTSAALLSGLPRLNLESFSFQSSDLGSYNSFECEGGRDSEDPTEDRSCSFNSQEGGLADYAKGAGLYTGIGILAAIFMIFGGLFFAVFSLFKLCCCCCNKVLPFDAVKTPTGQKKWATASFTVCLIMMLVCFCTSTFLGNHAITENTSTSDEYSAANALHGLKNIIYTFEPSATHAVLSSTSNVLAPAISKTNRTLNTAVNIHEFIRAFEIVNATVPKLPDAHAVVRMLNTTKGITRNGSAHMDLIIANLGDIDYLVDSLNNDTRYMYNQTLNLEVINAQMITSIYALNDTIQITMDFLNDIVGDDGVVATGTAELEAARRLDSNGLIPNTAEFQEASTGSSGSTARLISSDLNGEAAEITEMNDKLIILNRNLTALPNFTLTADRLVYLNDSINAAVSPTGIMTNLTARMSELGVAIKRPIPLLFDYLATVNSFESTLGNLTFEMSDSVAIVRVLMPLIETLIPQFEVLEIEVEKMYATRELLPIFDIVEKQFESISTTLFDINGTFLEDVLDTVMDVNTTLIDFLNNGTLADILAQVQEANSTVTQAVADADTEMDNLEDFQTVLEDSINDYNISDMNNTLVEAINLLIGVDFNETYQLVLQFEQSLEAIRIDPSFVQSLYTLQAGFESAYAMLERAVGTGGDYLRLSEGYCTGREDLYCSTDAECAAGGGTTCVSASLGVYRCSSPIGATTCTQDSDCSSVDASAHCLADATRASELHAVLVGFADDSSDLDSGAILADLRDITARSDVKLTDSTSMLDDGAESIEVFNTTDIFLLILDIEDGINDFDTESITTQMVDTQASISDVDFDSFLEKIEDQLDMYDKVANSTFVVDWLGTFETFKDFMFKENHLRAYLTRIGETALGDVLAASGPSAAFGHIGSQVDGVIEDFRLNQSGIDIDKRNDSYSTQYQDTYVVLDRAGASRYATTPYARNDQFGALYYLFSLADNFTVDNVRSVRHDHPLARGIFANSEGYQYADEGAGGGDVTGAGAGGAGDNSGGGGGDGDDSTSVYCFTLDCFAHTMDIVSTAPLTEVNAELYPPSYDEEEGEGGGALPDLDYSREEVMTLLWVPVLLLLFIGVCSLACSFVPRLHKMHLRCNCCFLSCALLLLPFVFLFSSVFFLFAMVGEDVCLSGTGIGESFITSFGDEFCPQVLKGTGTLDECRFNWTLPEQFGDDANITLSLSVLDTYNALLQKQCGMSVDPFDKLAMDLATQIRPLPLRAAVKALDGSDYDLRPPLQDIVNSTAANYGQVMYDLIAETNADGEHKVMSCESMSLVYAEVEDTMCGGVVLPGAWLIASWYFVAWVICCCGVPASCATLVDTKMIKTEELVGGEGEEEAEEGDEGDDDHRSAPDDESGRHHQHHHHHSVVEGELLMQDMSDDGPHGSPSPSFRRKGSLTRDHEGEGGRSRRGSRSNSHTEAGSRRNSHSEPAAGSRRNSRSNSSFGLEIEQVQPGSEQVHL
jgi:hypothetical protein